jgi:hypothetical protein
MSPKPAAAPSIRSETAKRTSTSTATAIVVDTRCKYVASSGRRCRAQAARDTSRASGFSAFCLPHAQMEQQYLDSESVAEDLFGPINDFRTNTAINEVLGNLLKLVAQNRIPLRNANALSYICQLLLNSNDGVRHETNLVGGKKYEMQIIKTSMDTMWRADDQENEESESEEQTDESETEGKVNQSAEKKTTFQSQVDAAVKILGG